MIDDSALNVDVDLLFNKYTTRISIITFQCNQKYYISVLCIIFLTSRLAEITDQVQNIYKLGSRCLKKKTIRIRN